MTTKEAKKTESTEATTTAAAKPAKVKRAKTPTVINRPTVGSKTTTVTGEAKQWYLINAENEVMGRLAVKVANILSGKNKSSYERHVDHGDHVIVINCAKLKVTGNKMTDKVYKSFSLYPSGLKERTLERVLAQDATFPFMHAVKGMLPHNSLGNHMLKKLNVYPDANHPHAAQHPKDITGK